jgi:hypothetical protein
MQYGPQAVIAAALNYGPDAIAALLDYGADIEGRNEVRKTSL